MSYDQRCHDLALAFLEDESWLSDAERKAAADTIAQAIQGTIEGEIEDLRVKRDLQLAEEKRHAQLAE
jgi:hypothetical protein